MKEFKEYLETKKQAEEKMRIYQEALEKEKMAASLVRETIINGDVKSDVEITITKCHIGGEITIRKDEETKFFSNEKMLGLADGKDQRNTLSMNKRNDFATDNIFCHKGIVRIIFDGLCIGDQGGEEPTWLLRRIINCKKFKMGLNWEEESEHIALDNQILVISDNCCHKKKGNWIILF